MISKIHLVFFTSEATSHKYLVLTLVSAISDSHERIITSSVPSRACSPLGGTGGADRRTDDSPASAENKTHHVKKRYIKKGHGKQTARGISYSFVSAPPPPGQRF